jgi:hypothetical protein
MRRSDVSDTPYREPTPDTKRHYSRVDPDMTDEEIDAWAGHFVDAVLAATTQGKGGPE